MQRAPRQSFLPVDRSVALLLKGTFGLWRRFSPFRELPPALRRLARFAAGQCDLFDATAEPIASSVVTETGASQCGRRRVPIAARMRAVLAPRFPAMFADVRQRHAQAATIFKAATRFRPR